MLRIAIVILTLCLSGCAGYRLGNIQGQEMRDVKTIFVPVAKNQSYEPGISVMLASAVSRRFNNDGTLALAANQKQADAVLEITITEVRRAPVRQSRSNVQVTDEYQVTLEAEATLTNLKQGKRIFTAKKVKGETWYFVQNNLQESERQALPMAAEDLANRLVSLVTEGW